MKNSTLTAKLLTLGLFFVLAGIVNAQVTINSYNFDAGWQGWADGGSDAGRSTDAGWSCAAAGSLWSKDDETANNYITSPVQPLAGYSQVDITFCHKNWRVDNGEGFDLLYYDGSVWHLLKSYVKGVDFTLSGQLNPVTFTFSVMSGSYTLSNNSQFRFSGTGDANNEYNFFDDVLIEGYSSGPEMDVVGNGASITDGDTTPAVGDDTDWGSVAVGTPVIHTFTINNTGSAALNLTGAAPYVAIGGANAAEFVVTTPPANVIAAGGSTTFDVTFTPAAAGLRTANITIANDDTDENPYNFNIQGTGISPAQEIDITGLGNSIANNDVTPSTTDDTDYGNVLISSSIVHTFTIHNTGGANNLNLTGGSPYVNIGGPHAGDFTLTAIPTTPITAGNSTTFDLRFSPSALGLRQAIITIANDDSDENPYIFAVQGNGVNTSCDGPLVNSYPYVESFDAGTGLWIQDLTDNFDWSSGTGGTPSGTTGPNGAHHGTGYLFTEASGNYNNTANLWSPCFDLTGTTIPRMTFFFHMYGQDMGTLNVDLSTDGGLTYPINLASYNGAVQNANQSSYIPISIDLSAYIGQVVKIRIQGITGGNYRSDMAIDYFRLTDKVHPTTGPGGVTSDLAVWLKANDGHSYT
ncbi:MAG: choice-of-anchor D domain-containing protein, partial [Bacteroidia bacterium]|nr:choice-of-anchor D domain-containing protein [Bacteroidia bacterium]